MGLGVDELRGRPPRIERPPVTGRVTKVDTQGVWVVPIGGDLRVPVGPCRGPRDIPVGTVVMVIWTQERPWVFGAELLTSLNADLRDIALLELAELAAKTYDAAVAEAAAEALAAHAADSTEVHGIPDTAALETQSGAQAKADQAETEAKAYTDEQLEGTSTGLGQHVNDTTNVHGIPDTEQLLEDVAGKLDATAYRGTGLRLVAAAGVVADLPDLEVVLRRRGDVVTVFTREAATAATHAGATALLTLPAGFCPDAPVVAADVSDETAAAIPGARLTATSTGAVRLVAVAGARHHGALTFTTSDTWPAELPGTED